MEDDKALRRNLQNTAIVLVGMLVFILIQAAALWHAGRFWEQARWTAAECSIPSAMFCLLGVVSVRRIQKQVLKRSSN
jgi:hypothetical protein